MRWLAQLAPILIGGVFAGSASADGAAFGDVGAMSWEPASLAPGTTRERYQLTLEQDRAPETHWYGFVGGDIERDGSADRETRSVLSAGSGYRFYDNDKLRLSLRGGLSFSGDELHTEERNRYPGLNWGFNWEQTFFDQHLNFFHRHHGNQELGSSYKLIINAATGLSVPLASGFSATARYDLEWDRSPREQARNTDHIYTLGLGYDW